MSWHTIAGWRSGVRVAGWFVAVFCERAGYESLGGVASKSRTGAGFGVVAIMKDLTHFFSEQIRKKRMQNT